MRFVLLAAWVCACTSPEPTAPKPAPVAPTTSAAPASPQPDRKCGMFADDWCPAPPGDPCGDHKDKASCAADARCAGMRYTGESLVACHYDERGFADNCPTVGCMSLPGTR